MIQQLPALVTLLNVLLQFATLVLVGRARGKYEIKAPAVSGHPLFERAYRVQMNTLEGTLMFLPVLWLAAYYGFPLWAGVLGLAWVLGRVSYMVGYMRDPSRRAFGFMLSTFCWGALGVLAGFGWLRAALAG